jgi:hypothetical protein
MNNNFDLNLYIASSLSGGETFTMADNIAYVKNNGDDTFTVMSFDGQTEQYSLTPITDVFNPYLYIANNLASGAMDILAKTLTIKNNGDGTYSASYGGAATVVKYPSTATVDTVQYYANLNPSNQTNAAANSVAVTTAANSVAVTTAANSVAVTTDQTGFALSPVMIGVLSIGAFILLKK